MILGEGVVRPAEAVPEVVVVHGSRTHRALERQLVVCVDRAYWHRRQRLLRRKPSLVS